MSNITKEITGLTSSIGYARNKLRKLKKEYELKTKGLTNQLKAEEARLLTLRNIRDKRSIDKMKNSMIKKQIPIGHCCNDMDRTFTGCCNNCGDYDPEG